MTSLETLTTGCGRGPAATTTTCARRWNCSLTTTAGCDGRTSPGHASARTPGRHGSTGQPPAGSWTRAQSRPPRRAESGGGMTSAARPKRRQCARAARQALGLCEARAAQTHLGQSRRATEQLWAATRAGGHDEGGTTGGPGATAHRRRTPQTAAPDPRAGGRTMTAAGGHGRISRKERIARAVLGMPRRASRAGHLQARPRGVEAARCLARRAVAARRVHSNRRRGPAQGRIVTGGTDG